MLQIKNIDVTLASVQALRGFSLEVPPSTVVGLTGRNGAGKTTVMRTVMGHLKPTRGQIFYDDQDLQRRARHQRAALGIGYMPEDRALVPQLTVEENILVPIWVSKTLRANDRLSFVYDVLPELRVMRTRRALLLSGGQQKLVALARALAVGTRLLLLDEPFEGVAPALADRLSDVIGSLRGSNLSVLISQSELSHSARLLDREVVIDRGR